jgi:hypothetical protein
MRFLFLALILVAGIGAAACGGDDDNATSTPTTAHSATATATTAATATIGGSPAGDSPFVVSVHLQDYAVVPSPKSGSAGDYEFQISNSGPSTHQFVAVKTDTLAKDLPTNSDGSVSEDDPSLTPIDKVEAIPKNGTGQFDASLEPGHYAFFCNIVEQGGGGAIAHYVQGMRTDFTVQ